MRKKLLVCDVEGTIFKAKFQIAGTDYSSTMWQPLAHILGEGAENEERDGNIEWDKPGHGKYGGNYLKWVEDTIEIHRKYGLTKKQFDSVLNSAEYNNGVVEFFHNLDRNKYIPIFISGGFQELIEKAQSELLGNDGEIVISHGFAACKYIWDSDGKLIAWNIQPTDFEDKYSFLKLMFKQYDLKDTKDWIFIGDGKNDSDIAARAPISFAINPHVQLASVATYTIESFDEIFDILQNDEASNYLSKKRGLSNSQALIVGQRMMCSNELSPYTVNRIVPDKKMVYKYILSASLENRIDSQADTFCCAVSDIIESLALYFDDEQVYSKYYETRNNPEKCTFVYNGTAKISAQFFRNEDSKRWAVHISLPDFGTEFRQSIVGCNYEIDAMVCCENTSVTIKTSVRVGMPDNSCFEKYMEELETFRPEFINLIGKHFTLKDEKSGIYVRHTFENKKTKHIDTIYNYLCNPDRNFPVVLINDNLADDTKNIINKQSIAESLFTFAHVYAINRPEYIQLFRRLGKKFNFIEEPNNIIVAVIFPIKYIASEKVKCWNLRELIKPIDAITYDTNKNCHVIISKEDPTAAFEANLVDLVLSEYKNNVNCLNYNYHNYAEELITQKNEADKKKYQKEGFDDIVSGAKGYVSEYIMGIEKYEQKAKNILDNFSRKKIIISYERYCGITELLTDGEVSFRLFRNAIFNSGCYSTAILQPFCNAVEQYLRCAILCMLKSDEKRLEYVIKNEKDNIMLGNQIGEFQYGLLKDLEANELIDILKTVNDSRHNVSHNYVELSIEELERKKCDFYYAIEEITKNLEKKG